MYSQSLNGYVLEGDETRIFQYEHYEYRKGPPYLHSSFPVFSNPPFTAISQHLPAFRCLEAVCWAVLRHTCLRPVSQYAVFQDAFTIPTVVRQHLPAFRCLEAVCWAVLRHTCLRPVSRYAVFQYTMFESTIIKYLDTVKSKDWSILGILEFARSNSNTKLSVATLNDFKEDLYSILSGYNDKCNVHVLAKNKVTKILSKFNSSFFTAEVKQFIKDLEYHEEARINVTSTYTATVLRDQQENQILIDQLRETSSEKEKEREKITRPLDVEEDDEHSYKRQCKDEGLSDLFEVLDDESFVEWEFDTPKPSWLDKIAHERDSLIYNAFNCNNKMIPYELSLNPIWWRIIDISDPEIGTLMSENELSELNAKFSSLLENWATLEPKAESYLQSLEKLDNDQLRTIGETVRPKGTHGAILELQKLLENIKEREVPESDNLFEDEKDNKTDQHKEISPLTPDDCMNPDVAFIFDLIRFTCEMISKGITQRPNTERDIDVFIKRHIFSCFDTILDSHFGEMVSRSSRNRRAEAINAPTNAEGYHLDWMFTRHDLGRELCWGREFSLCERTGSKIEDTPKIFSNSLKVQKTLRDMHQNLIKTIFAEGGGTLSKPVLEASTKLLMPGFLSSYFFMRAILIIYIGGGFYASVNLSEFYIPTKYQELEFLIKMSRIMLQIKKLLSISISRFKQMKSRAEKEKFALGKVTMPTRQREYRSFQKPRVPKEASTKDISPLIESQLEGEEAITPDPIPETEHSSTQSESLAKPKTSATSPPQDIIDEDSAETLDFVETEKKLQESHNYLTPPIQSETSTMSTPLDPKTVKKLLDQNQNKSLDKTSQSHKKKGTENITQVIADGIQDNILSGETKIQSFASLNHVTEVSATDCHQNSSTISLLYLTQLFDKATNAEYYAKKANQKEILCWINYGSEFIIQYNDLIKNSDSNIDEKKAKDIIYDKILEHITIIYEKRSKKM
ncbi:6042_t:CDS:10 [Ambispora gerdemannii]|uniref:6042_t:CDS:1 n=1 Tax=Ambispora gerdemannii TaxID=144530 RepID=A0A9N9BND2_9GLOM|nr:6042_t:CDS:10 [Ambispora gerdemannii]